MRAYWLPKNAAHVASVTQLCNLLSHLPGGYSSRYVPTFYPDNRHTGWWFSIAPASYLRQFLPILPTGNELRSFDFPAPPEDPAPSSLAVRRGHR